MSAPPNSTTSVNYQPLLGSFDNSGNLLTPYGPNNVPLGLNNCVIGATNPQPASFTTIDRNISLASAPITAATYTVTASDTHLLFNPTAGTTVTLPAVATNYGRELTMRTISGTQTVISATSNVAPGTSTTAGTAILAATAGKWCYMVCDGVQWNIQMYN